VQPIQDKANRITVMNRERHTECATITSGNVGPVAGVNMITNPTILITAPLRRGGKMRRNVLNIIGINNPVPAACKKRPDNNIGQVGAIAQIIVAIVNTVIVHKHICLVGNHCNNNADIGITIPITNISPVAIHCAVDTDILNSFINVVSAMFNNVSFKMAKNAPMINESIIGMIFPFGSSAKNSYFLLFVSSVIK